MAWRGEMMGDHSPFGVVIRHVEQDADRIPKTLPDSIARRQP
jgi:hypothetical protein